MSKTASADPRQTSKHVKLFPKDKAMLAAKNAFNVAFDAVDDAVDILASDVAFNFDTCASLKKAMNRQEKMIKHLQLVVAQQEKTITEANNAIERLQLAVAKLQETRTQADGHSNVESERQHQHKRKRSGW